LVRLLGDQASAVHSATGSLESFAKEVAGLDILVGLDSFAVHMAWRQGVRSVLINAGNPPELWSVPSGGRTLASSGGCPLYPCFNVPGCTGTEREYACVKSVTVRQVIESIQFECSAQPDSRSVPGPGNA
jgi:ADP-heptose:LPS heptosyltransferase